MSQKPTLPEPSIAYAADRERVRNAAILRLISNKLDKDKLAPYSGTPMFIINGATTAFPVPPGVSWTSLPFTTGSLFNSFLGELSGSIVTLSAGMTLQQAINLSHVAGIGAVNTICEIGIFKNGIFLKSLFQSVPYDKDYSIILIDYLSNLVTGDTLEVKMRHDNASNFVVNMIQSNWTLTQLTPNPIYMESRL